MPNLRASSAPVLIALLAACSTPAATSTGDGGVPLTDGKCEDLRGFFRTMVEAADCNSYRASLPQAVCISQVGCELTVETGGQLLKGRAEGRRFTLSAETPVKTECTGEIADDDLQMNCTSVVPLAREPYTCDFQAIKRTSSLETSYCCDLMEQSCGAGEKCNMVSLVSNRDPLAAVCMPLKGTAAEGESCERFGTEELNAGNDNCAEGQFCSSVSLPRGSTRVCRRICEKQTDCNAGETCYAVSLVPVAGFCLQSCELFGDDCADGTTCRRMGSLDESGREVERTACSGTGTAAIGGQCGNDNDCPAGASCGYQPGDRFLKCRTMCDEDHGCGPNSRCVPFNSSASTGVCVSR